MENITNKMKKYSEECLADSIYYKTILIPDP